jgi:hypothetical protein
MSRELRIAAYLDQVRSTIREHGWAIQAAAVQPDETALFAYTVGMTEAGLPELLVLDPPSNEHAATLLNTAGHFHRARPGGLISPSAVIIDGQAYTIAELPRPQADCVRVARAIYGDDVRVFMIISKANLDQSEARR